MAKSDRNGEQKLRRRVTELEDQADNLRVASEGALLRVETFANEADIVRKLNSDLEIRNADLTSAIESLKSENTGLRKAVEAAATNDMDDRQALETANEELQVIAVELEAANRKLEEQTEELVLEVTERTRAEQVARESEERTQNILDSLADGAITINANGIIEYANSETERIFGYSTDELIDKNLSMLMSGSDRNNHDGFLSNYLKTGKAKIIGIGREVVGLRKDGTTFPFYLTVSETELKGRTIFTGTLHDMSARKKILVALLEAKREAEVASQAKSEFLSSMSHELRTPLNAILGFSQLLRYRSEEISAGQRAEYLDLILSSGEHLLGLVERVLELTKIEAGKITLSIEDVALHDIVGASVDSVSAQAADRGVVILDRSADLNLPDILCDPMVLKQALLNLLSNAVKFNRKDGTVTVACGQSEDGMLRISVTDTGRGISESNRRRLFEPFDRLGMEGSDIEGAGIGLTIAKRLVELMDGSIDYDSVEGEGSTFWIELPLAEALAASDGRAQPEAAGDQPIHALTDKTHADGKTVLYVEDNPSNVLLMKEILDRLCNLTMISAASAEEGLELIRKTKPDIILMDIQLPGMDGIDALKELRRTEAYRNIPVIALTAQAMPKDVKKGVDAGFDCYITKPIRISEILSALGDLLK